MNLHRKTCLLLFLMLGMLTEVFPQEQKRLTLETMTDPSLRQALSVPRTWWIGDDAAYVYDARQPAEQQTLERFDAKTGTRTAALDRKKAQVSFARLLSGDTPHTLPSLPQELSENGNRALYVISGDIFVIDLPSSTVTRLTQTEEEESAVRFSPDASHVAFVRNHDLYAMDIGKRKETRLTKDGSETVLNGSLSWVYWEEIFGRQDIAYWWSPDSRSIAFLRTDESAVSVQHYVDFTPWTPTVTTQRYPKVGEVNPNVRVGIVDAASGKTAWVQIAEDAYEYIMRVDWLPGSKSLFLRTLNRLQTDLDFYSVEAASGKTTFVMRDSNPGWLNVSDDLYFTSDGRHFIISSERSGYAHLYRFTMKGELANQITSGSWALSSSGPVFWVRKAIAGVDEKNGWVYFTGLEKSSIEKHLYRINMDGSGMKRLTRGDGTHIISMSPDCRYYFDRFSSVSTAPSLTLVEVGTGKETAVAESNPAGFKTYNIQSAELLTIPARDGFKLPASLTKPADFNPKRKYPVIVYVYGGPSAPTVSNQFSASAIWDNVLANNGFLVMRVDNRAATGISKTTENLMLHQSPGDVELNDLVDGVRWMKKQPFVDPDRFGIWGWSGGGTNTMLAMTRSTEFKAGIAGAGVTDFRFYDTKWAEAMMRTEKENLKGFEKASLLQHAKNLHGKLLLIHGTHDDNVHIQNTWRFADELINANKLFELMVYPKRKHGVNDPAGRSHLNNVMLDFWKRNL